VRGTGVLQSRRPDRLDHSGLFELRVDAFSDVSIVQGQKADATRTVRLLLVSADSGPVTRHVENGTAPQLRSSTALPERSPTAGVFARFMNWGIHVPAVEYGAGLTALNREREMEVMVLSANEESLIKVVRMLPPDEAKKC
jgi:hypothetical protein